ncbi:MAG: hypothetical protein FRX49_00823 [Trebouxia sp. A1-2]|nr:MAG: hypothetical protein FRX49_00823 [Trebouxia sp. A1-2]
METISAKATRCKFCCIPIEPPIKMRKVKAFMDDAEVIIPLKGYNPETRTKISSHITTTARSTAGQTPRHQGGTGGRTAPHHMQGPYVFTADATGHDTHAAQPSMWGGGHEQGQDQSQQKKNNVPPSLATLKLVLSYNACGHCDTWWSRKQEDKSEHR